MPPPAQKAKKRSVSNSIIPDQFAYIFDYKPVLWCESEASYCRLLADFVCEFSPRTLLEYQWVKNVADIQWEVIRYQRLKSAAIIAEMPNATREYLGYDFDRQARELGLDGGGDMLVKVMRLASKGNEWSVQKVDKLVEFAGVTYDVLLYKSYAASGGVMNDLSNRLLKLEQRRDDIIKRLEDRRRSIAAHQKSLVKSNTEDSIIELDDGAGDGEAK